MDSLNLEQKPDAPVPFPFSHFESGPPSKSSAPAPIRNKAVSMVGKLQIIVVVFVLGYLSSACDARQEHLIRGRTMGTTYNVKVVTGYFRGVSDLKEKIARRLEQINQSMSTYQKDSEISRFNRFNRVGEPFHISDDFLKVVNAANKIHRLSGGAWDGTVNPLIDLWGFGAKGRHAAVPSEAAISAILPEIGFNHIEINADGYLVKKHPAVSLDLSSIAKGFGVDAVAEVVRSDGHADFLVEIGGEVYAAGFRQDGQPWRIGINRPRTDAPADEVYRAVSLSDQAFATSGDYRNFFEVNGVRYSHVIDPRTGYPVSNGVVSVSIITDTCMFADALATAVMVMGTEKGLALINRLKGVEGMIVFEKEDGRLADLYSQGFPR